MKRLVAVVAGVLLVAGILAGCQPAGHTAAEAAFDEAIHELEHEFTAFYTQGPSASVASIREAATKIDAEWSKIESAAKDVEGMDVKEAAAAHTAFNEAVKGLTDGTPDDAAMAAVMPRLEAFRKAVDKMHAAAGLHE
jgi:hypothetical protein